MPEPINTVGMLSFAIITKHGMLALLGAIAHAMNAHRIGRSKTLMDFFLLVIISSFSGLLFSLLALQFFHSEYLTLAAAGAGGYSGVEGLTVLTKKIREMIANAIK